MTARASKHSVVAQQWVCARLRPHTVRVPSRSLGKIPKDCGRGRATKSSVADRSLEERGGEHLIDATCGREGELGEDHSECTSDQQLQPGVIEEDQPRSPHDPTRSANQRIQWKAPPKAKGRGQSESRTRERRRGVRASAHISPPPVRRPVCAHRRAGARSRLEGVSHEQAFAATGGTTTCRSPPSEV